MEQTVGIMHMERTAVKTPNKWVKLAETFREMRSGNTEKAMKAWQYILK